MSDYTVGSLFSGIGGLDLGLEWAGLTTAWQVEIDPFCHAVLERHWPHIPRRRYVQGVAAAIAAGDLARPDIIAGGFPCQDASSANPGGRGIDGGRTGLVWHMLDVIDAAQPLAVVAENVLGLARRGLDDVVGELCRRGYDVDVSVISAAAVGAPHQRDRIGIVAVRAGAVADADGERRRQPGQPRPAERDGRAARGSCERQLADADSGRREQLGPAQPAGEQGGGRPAQPGLGGGADGLSARLDSARWPAGRGQQQHPWEPPRLTDPKEPHRRRRLKALGNAVVPLVGYVLGLRVMQRLRQQEDA